MTVPNDARLRELGLEECEDNDCPGCPACDAMGCTAPLEDDTPECNCGTCTPPHFTCIRSD
jgi:hypothetical protein